MQERTHFGFQEVPVREKQRKVNAVFSSVADHYDLMNQLMSGGIHHYWKQFAFEQAFLRPEEKVLDLACGTGDISALIQKKMQKKCPLTLCDINMEMMSVGRNRLIESNLFQGTQFVCGNAENLPFKRQSFDCIFIGFGLRNVTNIDKALASMYEMLRPGGRVIILEFSKPTQPLFEACYDAYSFYIIPQLGKYVAGDAESYQYLAESIRKHPNQEQLKEKMQKAGFEQVNYFNLTLGIVAVHRGYKF